MSKQLMLLGSFWSESHQDALFAMPSRSYSSPRSEDLSHQNELCGFWKRTTIENTGGFMKSLFLVGAILFSINSFAQQAVVDISLRPAGSFKVKSTEVKGFAVQKPDHVEAQNIIVNLKNVETGITLRDTHTKKHLEVDKFPEAVLLKAEGRNGKGTGVIKIRGIEKPIAGTYEIQGSNLNAHFALKLSDFKIEGIKYMGVGVADDVQLNVTVPLKK